MEVTELLEVRAVPRLVQVENDDDQTRPFMIATNATSTAAQRI